MATGIPGKLKRNVTPRNGSGIPFRLEYEGKLSVEDILNISPADLNCIISVEKHPRNRLIYGENLRVLKNLLNDTNVAGKVKLIYIDPPYATGFGFESRKQSHAYHDSIDGADYLEFIRQRLILLKELLADDGSIYVHLDENMAFPIKILMDEILALRTFGTGSREKSVIRKTILVSNMEMFRITSCSTRKAKNMFGTKHLRLGQMLQQRKNIST